MPRIPWDKYESAILIDSYIRISKAEAKWADEVKRVSALLRSRAIADGQTIDDSFRNKNGINLRLWEIKYQFTGEKGIQSTSALFKEMVLMYNTKPKEFSKILREARKCEANIISSRRPFDLDESVILLNALMEGRNQNIATVQIARSVSLQLRTMAINKGLIIGDSYRCCEGIKGRLRCIEAALNGRSLPGSSIPQVFSDAITLYRSHPSEFNKVLRATSKYTTLQNPRNASWSKAEASSYFTFIERSVNNMKQPNVSETKNGTGSRAYVVNSDELNKYILQADIDGVSLDDVVAHMNAKGRGTKPIYDFLEKTCWVIAMPTNDTSIVMLLSIWTRLPK